MTPYPIFRFVSDTTLLARRTICSVAGLLALTTAVLTVTACSNTGQADTASVESIEIPSTLAGRRFAVWLDAHNSGSTDSLQVFVLANYSEASFGERPAAERTESFKGLAEAMGRLYPRRMEVSKDLAITVLMYSADTDGWYRFSFELEPDQPHYVRQMTVAVDNEPNRKR